MNKICNVRGMRILMLLVADIICIDIALWFALLARFEFVPQYIPANLFDNAVLLMPFFTIMTVFVFFLFKLYNSLWAYASIKEAVSVVVACAVSVGVLFVFSVITGFLLPKACYILILLCLMLEIGAVRFSYRLLRSTRRNTVEASAKRKGDSRIMLIGAGDAGSIILREINTSKQFSFAQVVCVIDDDFHKWGKYINGIKVVGGIGKLKEAVDEFHVTEIIFAIPSASNEVRKTYLEVCKETTCVLKILPGVYQSLRNNFKLTDIRKVEIADLLGREQISLQNNLIQQQIAGKTVLVTGAGGSIGSELCRQLASNTPQRLVLLDIYENTTYELQLELQKQYPDLHIDVLIGSVRDKDRIDNIFAKYRPNIVCHAAAHKHVPLMEDSPNEAVKNNVFGTLNVVKAADKYGVDKFIQVSTDKAVNPTNVMGATKRICEMIIQVYDSLSKTDFVAVRFGNVLGSNGSVVPFFEKQIAAGGPVTVTHPDIIRYFMTIPEAVSLILQTGSFANGGEIFVLDMGEPVKIVTLAENMIRLSGRVPYKDIGIKFIGLRPGEKLKEELLMSEEGLIKTAHSLIYVGQPIKFSHEHFFACLAQLEQVMNKDSCDIRPLIKELVPTFSFQTAANADCHQKPVADVAV